ncbi:hypothetical protein C8R47DRAFT_1063642 [Mycena vitilis]|nr:hypothetical protein C8R47DRAFT_1063642 [Mycena vitilis]
MPAATKVNLALLAYIQSPTFCPVELPELRASTWEAVIELEVPIGCKNSPYDLFVVEGKRIFDWVLFRAISSTLDLTKYPLGLVHPQHIETTVSTDMLLGEIFRAVDKRTLLQSVSAIRDGFFAFIGAYWTQAGENIEAVCRWLLPPFEPLISIIAVSYKPTLNPMFSDDDPRPKATRAVAESRNREPHGIFGLQTPSKSNPHHSVQGKLPGLFTDSDSSFDTTESSDVVSPEVHHPLAKESPARLPSPPAIPCFGEWGLSPLRREVMSHGPAISPSVLAFCLPDAPNPSGLSEELGGGEVEVPNFPASRGVELKPVPTLKFQSNSLLPGFEPGLPRRMAALTLPGSQAMPEKDPFTFPDQKFTFKTPPPPDRRVSWEDHLKFTAHVSPDHTEDMSQEIQAIVGEASNDLTVPKPSTPASGDGARRPLTPLNSPHNDSHESGKDA